MTRRFQATLIAGVVLSSVSAQAADLRAIVEEATNIKTVQVLDYLTEGQNLRLPADASLTLCYFTTCTRERIVGGVVVVGRDRSEVTGGQVERETVRCDRSALRLSAAEARQSGASAVRGLHAETARIKPELVLYHVSPVFKVDAGATLSIERLDRSDAKITLPLDKTTAMRPRIFDSAKANVRLASGGTYRASVGNRSIVFAVDPRAEASDGPLLGRLVHL